MDYPTNAELSAFLVTHVFHWSEVRWIAANRCYAGTRLGSSTLTPVPDFVTDSASHVTIMQTLTQAYHLQTSLRVDEARGVMLAIVGPHEVEGASIGQALCRAAWLAIDTDERF